MVFRTSSTCILTRRKFNINKCVCSTAWKPPKTTLISISGFIASEVVQLLTNFTEKKKSLYVSALRLIKFSLLSREPFKEERVKLAAGVRATGKWAGGQVPPSYLCPSLWPAPYFPRMRPPLPPRDRPTTSPAPTPQPRRPRRSGARQSPKGEADLWSIITELLSPHSPPPAPPPPTAEAEGVEPSRGRGRATPIPLPPALSAFRGNCTFYYFNFSSQDARPGTCPSGIRDPGSGALGWEREGPAHGPPAPAGRCSRRSRCAESVSFSAPPGEWTGTPAVGVPARDLKCRNTAEVGSVGWTFRGTLLTLPRG